VTHCTFLSAVSLLAMCTRWPAVAMMRFHVLSEPGFWMWHSAQMRVGTLPCFGISSGRSAIHMTSWRALATCDCRWQSWQPSLLCSDFWNLAHDGFITWQPRQKSFSCSMYQKP